MDFSAFVQENKRWLLGCLLGLVVFFVGRSIIGSMYDPSPDRSKAMSAVSTLPSKVYTTKSLSVLEEEARELAEVRTRMRDEIAFEQSATYRLEGQSMSPDQYLGKVGRDLKLRVQRGAAERNVEIKERRGLVWPAETSPDRIRMVLFGLELLDEAAARLFAAHDAVREQDPNAMGLVSLSLVVEEQRSSTSSHRRGRKDFDPGEVVRTQQVTFEFEADEHTAMRFLESLRQPARTMTLQSDGFVWTKPVQRGDPTKVKGKLEGVTFPEN